MKDEEFDAKNQSKFIHALATTAGTLDDLVHIVSISQSRRRSKRAIDPFAFGRLVITAEIAAESLTQARQQLSLLDSQTFSKSLATLQLPPVILQSVSILNFPSSQDSGNAAMVRIGVGVGVALFVCAALSVALLYRHLRLRQMVSRRLIGAKSGAPAQQADLPWELRSKYAAVKVLGCGAFGVVIEAWQLNNGRRAIRRAVKLVHARGRVFTQTESRRLEREVCFLPSFD
jgi:hypothetical protein